MGKKSAEEILGFEFDWLASDKDDHVALFSTAGGGYSPGAFLQDTEIHDTAIDAILALPVRTKARLAPRLPAGLRNTWHLMAERGVFGFDSDPNGGPYRLIAAPEEPVRTTDLPEVAAAVARRIVLRDLRFEEAQEITREYLEQCC